MMSNRKLFMALTASAMIGGMLSVATFKALESDDPKNDPITSTALPTNFTKPLNTPSDYVVPEGLNFVTAAKRVTPAVVHIKTFSKAPQGGPRDEFLREFFGIPEHGGGQNMRRGSGSGVIISSDGYIVTNNHVVDGANEIEVVLEDKRSYKGKVLGTDPTTDLALVKVEEKDLPYLTFGDSDDALVGQWVLAVGNPFDLTSTVTAGIISAKARSINILRGRADLAIESFIQTDAAVNPGNSGGALVDLNGNLIGINTAIASQTGSFTGYSFAVPSELARKVVEDIKEFGEVQRAVMGISILDVNAALKEDKGLDKIEGVYVAGVGEDSGADDAGIEAGDVILEIDGTKVNTVSALQELVARKHPGDKVDAVVKRAGKMKELEVTLKNRNNSTTWATSSNVKKELTELLGANFRVLTDEEKEKFELENGVVVSRVYPGKLQEAGIRKGFIITHADRQVIEDVEKLNEILNEKDAILLEGIYPGGSKKYYGLGLQ
ncbi:Do family serine endopeptidase [Algivirga pacifica]|uniref:Trypsin-like peptidase domain-containing protein n=1 Tax=Algivirga pacifica TaxID=1162670 RepID=A0ABP9DHW1_9BACT